MANSSTPVIISAILSPNPAQAGKKFLVSIAATDVEAIPQTAVYVCGEFVCGEP